MTPLRAIREHCLECQGWDGQGVKPMKGVRECLQEGCRFHPYRMGKSFSRKGKGGNPGLKTDPIMETIRDLL